MKITVDRTEKISEKDEFIAVCEILDESGKTEIIEIPLEILPDGAKEGDSFLCNCALLSQKDVLLNLAKSDFLPCQNGKIKSSLYERLHKLTKK